MFSPIVFLGHILPVIFILGTLYFLLLSASNVLWLRLSSQPPRIRRGRMASVLIPARDEESNIGPCIQSLLDQSYQNYEIVVLDDQSRDATWRIIEGYARRFPERVRAIRGEPLPARGWSGKTHAMQQLAGVARGEYLMFTDADTVHGRQSVSWAVTNLEAHRADCISGYVSQRLVTLGELFIVPTIYIMSAMVLPLWLIGATRASGLSFAIGQLIVFRRRAFEAIGGYASVRDQISDDVAIARELKRAGFRQVFLDVRRHVSCRMYSGYRASFNGISKNIYDFAKRRSLFLAMAITLLVGLVVLPCVLVPILLITGNPGIQFALLCVALFLAAWMLALYDRGLPWWSPLLYPVMFLHLLYMAWWSIAQAFSGRSVVWKGRALR
jgi:chlorobactene glucosyltransferase